MPTPTPEAATRSMRILHAGMLVILIGFGAGAWLYIRGLEPPRDPASGPTFASIEVIFYLLAAIALVMLAMIPVIRSRVLPVIPPGVVIRGGQQGMDRAVATVLGKWANANLITWALAMSVGLYGVVVAAMLRQIWPYPIFAVPAAAVLLHYRPRLTQAQGWVRALGDLDRE